MNNNIERIKKQKIAFNEVFSTPSGALVLKQLQDLCCYDKTTFDANSSHTTAFNEGKRFVFLTILNLVNLTSDEYDKLIRRYQNLFMGEGND